MSTLSADPFNLALGDLVVAMVKASNEKGPG
jgi:molybdopterin-binding protein